MEEVQKLLAESSTANQPVVNIGGDDYNARMPSDKEIKTFDNDYDKMMIESSDLDQALANDIRGIMQKGKGVVLKALMAQQFLKSGPFSGLSVQSSGYAVAPLVPHDFGKDGNEKRNWQSSFASGTVGSFVGWLGTPGALTTSFSLYEYCAVVIFGEYTIGDRITSHIEFTLKAGGLPPWPVPPDNQPINLYPAPIVVLGTQPMLATRFLEQQGIETIGLIGCKLYKTDLHKTLIEADKSILFNA